MKFSMRMDYGCTYKFCSKYYFEVISYNWVKIWGYVLLINVKVKAIPLQASFLLETESTPEPQSMKNYNDIVGNRTRDFPAWSAVPQQTAPSCAPTDKCKLVKTNVDI
jgi:hypothetical protein